MKRPAKNIGRASSRLLSRRNFAAVPASLAAYGLFREEAKAADDAGVARTTTARPELVPGVVVDVREFGAKGDGATNDAPAFNAAIQYIRDHQGHVEVYDVCHKLRVPSGVYAVSDSINLTRLRAINMVLDGDGSVILGKCKGEPVIDALGSRWLTIRDLTIIGDSVYTPKLGIQIGLVDRAIVADDHYFEDVKILGHYSLACLLNLAAETTGFDHVLLWNTIPDPRTYSLIQDGVNHFGATSKFATSQAENREQSYSFNENEFINCDFRHGGGGVPVWLGDTARHRFIRCYSATAGETSFVIYCGQNGHTMLDIDCHCEAKGLKAIFLFTGTRKAPVIHGFTYQDHRCFSSGTVFRTDDHITTIALQDADIDIAFFAFPACKVFDDPQKWTVVGRYASPTDRQWNGINFTGETLIGYEFNLVGNIGVKVASGPDTKRPQNLGQLDAGRLFFDTSLSKLIVWTGTAWADTAGRPL